MCLVFCALPVKLSEKSAFSVFPRSLTLSEQAKKDCEMAKNAITYSRTGLGGFFVWEHAFVGSGG